MRSADLAREILSLAEDCDVLWMQAALDLVSRARSGGYPRGTVIEINVADRNHIIVRNVTRTAHYDSANARRPVAV